LSKTLIIIPLKKREEEKLLMRKVLVTGGCGFIGSNFIRYLLQARPTAHITNLDSLTYAGNLENVFDLDSAFPHRYAFVKGDIGKRDLVQALFSSIQPDWVIHFAAESHVDRSIMNPEIFVQSNVLGTFNLLEAARAQWSSKGSKSILEKRRFLHISTDEVYGSLGETGRFKESSPYNPSSPYSASKASADHMVRAYFRTYDLPAMITNCTNNYGPYQFPEKLIPLMILHALEGKELPVYGDGGNIRDWLYVEDHCEALLKVLEKGQLGNSYNIGGCTEIRNKDLVTQICDLLDSMKKPLSTGPRRGLIRFVPDRPGHDRRYAMDISKIQGELGWQPRTPFEKGLQLTIQWYLQHSQWVKNILDGSYLEHFDKSYGEKTDG
jgi:dTDP-glucose 4,6-dehydratase